jgi:HEAT repeat protein
LIPVEIGVFTVDADLVVRTWDAWMETHTGIAAAAACGRPLGEVVPSLVERGLIQRFAQVVSSGEVQVLAPAFHHYLVPCAPRQASPNFAQMQQRATLGPLREDNRIVGVMATIEDVTVRIDRERQLAASLRADDWKVRRSAVDELSREARPEMLASLVTALRNEHRNFNVLSSALQLLSASDVDLTAPLAALLREPDADLRIQAALALGERQTAGAIEALIGALGDPDINVRFHAIEALGRMHAADAVDALADIAEGEDFFLVFPAIDALAKMHDARVAPRLIPLLRRNDVTEAVADALAGLGNADAVRPLVGVLNTTGPAAPIARALAQIYERYESRYGGGALIAAEFQAAIRPPGAQRLLDALATTVVPDLSGLVTVVGWLRGPAVEQALARLLGQAAVRPAVIEAIVRQDGGIVDLLIDQLGGEDADVRLSAIVALGRLGDGRATPALTAMLAGDRAEIVAAASALARIGDVSAFEALLPLLAHADSTVRQAAIGALNSLGHPDMAARVCDLLSSPDSRVRESAVRIAGYFGYPECSEAVVRLASDTDEAVRRAAVEHLPFLDDPRAAPSLVAALADRSGRVRAAAAQALAHMPRPAADAALIEASADADAWVRYYAVRSLGTLGDPAVLTRLAAIAASDPAMHVRIAAVESVGAIGGDPAADILLRYASSEDADLASAALRSLGRTSHAEAVAAMREALRSGDPPRRLAAVTGLRACVSREAVDVLQWTAVADSEDSVALAAVEALGAIAGKSDRQADAAVAALVATLAEPSRRVAAVAVLSRLPERQIARVAAGLTHPNPLVRRVLVDVLARLRHPEASAAIRGALDDADAAVREAAIVALDQLAVRGIRPRLAQLAQSDESRAVRRAAASALGRSTDGPDAQADGIA